MKRKVKAAIYTQLSFADMPQSKSKSNANRKMELLNAELPERRLSVIKDVLKTNNLSFPVPDADHYNCWGYVAFSLKWEDRPVWLQGSVMDEYLSLNTKPITKDEATVGDIVVFRRGTSLNHTALLTHEHEIICHKPGASDLCVDTMKRAIGMYGNEITYARPIDFP